MVIVVCAGMLLSFIFGVVTVQYRIFPFEQLREIKQIASPSPGPNYSDYFYHKKSFFEQHGGHHYDVVLIGDSITDSAEWEDLFPALKIANRGISGDRTDSVLKRLESIYSTSARRAFIMIGMNDFSSSMSVDEVFENYKTIVNKLTAHGMKVYIQSTIFAGKRRENLNIKIAELNERLQQLAAQTDSITYIDLNAGLAQDSLLKSMYSRDDVHLNGDGYAMWKDLINPYIQ
jgi:lysophospholipase L1-like esterase